MFDRPQRPWDVIVVGAGPAGSSAAFFAARGGARTLLLERQRFPRDKTCGDGVGAAGVKVLETMGVYARLIALPGVGQASGFGVASPGGRFFRHDDLVLESTLQPRPLLIAPRAILDEHCARAAEEAGATLVQEQRVATLLRSTTGQVTGVQLADGTRLRSTLVIGADGVHSRVARALGQHPRPPHGAFALRVYFRGLSRIGTSAFFIYDRRFLPAYFWIFPLPGNRANVGIGRFEGYGAPPTTSLNDLFWRFAAENPIARELLEGGEPQGKLRGWPLRLGPSAGTGVGPGALLVGDANGFVDPLTGEGIHFALRSGQLAGEAALEALAARDPSMAQLRTYERAWRREFEAEFTHAQAALDLLMARPTLTDAVVDLARTDRAFAVLLGEVLCGARPKRDLLTARPLLQIGGRWLRHRLERSYK